MRSNTESRSRGYKHFLGVIYKQALHTSLFTSALCIIFVSRAGTYKCAVPNVANLVLSLAHKD
jgi:hypothetical protein